jgi:hypothetical protein
VTSRAFAGRCLSREKLPTREHGLELRPAGLKGEAVLTPLAGRLGAPALFASAIVAGFL